MVPSENESEQHNLVTRLLEEYKKTGSIAVLLHAASHSPIRAAIAHVGYNMRVARSIGLSDGNAVIFLKIAKEEMTVIESHLSRKVLAAGVDHEFPDY